VAIILDTGVLIQKRLASLSVSFSCFVSPISGTNAAVQTQPSISTCLLYSYQCYHFMNDASTSSGEGAGIFPFGNIPRIHVQPLKDIAETILPRTPLDLSGGFIAAWYRDNMKRRLQPHNRCIMKLVIRVCTPVNRYIEIALFFTEVKTVCHSVGTAFITPVIPFRSELPLLWNWKPTFIGL